MASNTTPSIRLLHTADVHIDSPLKSLALRNPDFSEKIQSATRAAFSSLIDFALAEEVSALLISGDLYDGAERSAKSAAYLTDQFDRLRLSGIPVFYIKGNHDAENPLSGEVTLPNNVHVFTGHGGKVQLGDADVWIHGVSFSGKQAPESLLNKFSSPVENAINIGMLHTSLAGSAAHDNYAPCSISALSTMGFDYWALGHIHKRQVHNESPWIVMPGIPQGRDIGESGSKSATLLTIDEDTISIEEVLTSQVEFLQVTIDITKSESDEDIRQLIRTELQAVIQSMHSKDAILRVTLSGTHSRRWQLIRFSDVWFESTITIANEVGNLWIEKFDLALREPLSRKDSNNATDELSELMSVIGSEPGFKSQLLAEITDALTQLPPNQRALLAADEVALEALASSIASAGQEHVLALMKSTTE